MGQGRGTEITSAQRHATGAVLAEERGLTCAMPAPDAIPGSLASRLFIESVGDRRAVIELDWTTRRRRVIIPAR